MGCLCLVGRRSGRVTITNTALPIWTCADTVCTNSYCAWGVHRNTRIFGHDADVFRPDRWLEAQGEQLQSMERNNDLIFGHGRFTCLGKTVAFMELNKVFVEVRTLECSSNQRV